MRIKDIPKACPLWNTKFFTAGVKKLRKLILYKIKITYEFK